jgi:hypothetical protein
VHCFESAKKYARSLARLLSVVLIPTQTAKALLVAVIKADNFFPSSFRHGRRSTARLFNLAEPRNGSKRTLLSAITAAPFFCGMPCESQSDPACLAHYITLHKFAISF